MVSRNQIARHHEFCDLLHHRQEECFYRPVVIWPESIISDGKLDQVPGGREATPPSLHKRTHTHKYKTNKHLPRPWWWKFIFKVMKCSFYQILFTRLENSKQKSSVTNTPLGIDRILIVMLHILRSVRFNFHFKWHHRCKHTLITCVLGRKRWIKLDCALAGQCFTNMTIIHTNQNI